MTQTDEPYGVREAFTLFVGLFCPDCDFSTRGLLEPPEEETAFLKLTLAASESHAVAPPAAPTPATPGSGTVAGAVAGQPGAGPGGQGDDDGGGPAAEEAGPGTGELAFTGSAVLTLALIGACLVVAGLTASRQAVRHRRTTV